MTEADVAETQDKIADVLERAADLIEPEGAWAQGFYGGKQGNRFCAVGAIGKAAGIIKPRDAENWVDANAAAFIGMDHCDLEEWNDAPDREQVEVVAKLREAAASARASVLA